MLLEIARLLHRKIKRRRPLEEAPPISGNQFIFVCGLHRSGTSILHRLFQQCPAISGMMNTGFPEDEGQHLQSVFPPALAYGGPGRFAFDPASQMTESSLQNARLERDTLLREWGAYFDLNRQYFIEKSPPNLLRARYLQHIFPGATFIFIVRHPIAVSLATKKWAKTTYLELMMHWHVAHMVMFRDMPYIENKIIVRYEDIIRSPKNWKNIISRKIGINDFNSDVSFSDRNTAYFNEWNSLQDVDTDFISSIVNQNESPMMKLGYLMEEPFIIFDDHRLAIN